MTSGNKLPIRDIFSPSGVGDVYETLPSGASGYGNRARPILDQDEDVDESRPMERTFEAEDTTSAFDRLNAPRTLWDNN